jgi:hypothetical protein
LKFLILNNVNILNISNSRHVARYLIVASITESVMSYSVTVDRMWSKFWCITSYWLCTKHTVVAWLPSVPDLPVTRPTHLQVVQETQRKLQIESCIVIFPYSAFCCVTQWVYRLMDILDACIFHTNCGNVSVCTLGMWTKRLVD